jgi:hypothetical protein
MWEFKQDGLAGAFVAEFVRIQFLAGPNLNSREFSYFYCLATVAVRSSMVVWRYARDGDSTAPARCAAASDWCGG